MKALMRNYAGRGLLLFGTIMCLYWVMCGLTRTQGDHILIPKPATQDTDALVDTFRYVQHTKDVTEATGKEFISESEALRYGPLTDIHLAADARTSTVEFIETKNAFNLGEKISLKIRLMDGHGKPRTIGGDLLRARMVEESKKAFACGHVIDHMNGTYTATFTSLWAGNPRLTVSIAYNRESVRALYHIRKELPNTRGITAIFKTEKASETTACHPNKQRLKSYNKICDLTMENSGDSWFCGQPTNKNLLCEDWYGVGTGQPYPNLPITEAEKSLLQRAPITIGSGIEIKVIQSRDNNDLLKSDVKCVDYNTTKLWFEPSPVGYFYNDVWNIKRCKGAMPSRFPECLKDTQVILTGDSTSRQWYANMLQALPCTPITEAWTKEKWHKPSACKNKVHNFTVEWRPHAQPFFVGGNDVNRYTRHSISRSLSEIDSSSKVVFLIHVYMHALAYHPDVFRSRIRTTREEAEKLLKRNPQVRLLFKGPHTFHETPAGVDRLNDYFGNVYKSILVEEFSGLLNRIIYLDSKDMTNSKDINPNHPPGEVVTAMVKQMFSYICE